MEKDEQKWEQGLGKEEEEPLRRSNARSPIDIGSVAAAALPASQENSIHSNGHANGNTNGHINAIQPPGSVAENGFHDGAVLVEEQEGPDIFSEDENGRIEHFGDVTEASPKSSSSNCVYYDKDGGLWKCRFCCWNYGSTSRCIDLVQNLKWHSHELMISKTLYQSRSSLSFKIEEHIGRNSCEDASGIERWNLAVPKGLDSTIAYQGTETQRDDNLSILKPSEIVEEEHATSYNASKIQEVGILDTDVINESDLEITELDVEKVLQNQNTHDLYCPNCNSCITRRVILCKRKRVRVTTEDVKRNKQGIAIDSKVNDTSGQASNDAGCETAGFPVDATSELLTNDSEHDRESDFFRCLSCFSIFIPTGNSLKLFKIFGDKGKKTWENKQKSATSKQGMQSVFSPDKEKGPWTGIQADAEKQNSEVCTPSSNLNDKNERAESQKDGDKFLHSSNEKELFDDKLMIKIEGNSGSATMMKLKGDTENAGMNKSEVDTSKDVPACSQMDQSVAAGTNRTSFLEGESPEGSKSVYQPDGLKILISSNEGSTILDKLQTYHSTAPAIQNTGADDSILPLPTTLPTREGNISVGILHEQEPVEKVSNESTDGNGPTLKQNNDGITIHPTPEGNMNISVSILHEHEPQILEKVSNESTDGNGTTLKQNNDDGASPIELSQYTFNKDKVEIHAWEHLKNDKDALVLSVKDACLTEERLANIARDLKKVTVEHIAGKDTIIFVESGRTTTSASEQVQDLNATSEIGSLPHLATHIDTVEPMAGDARETYHVEIIKSIVYGGLFESITSLGVVSSAAGGGTATINILALALANLISGLVFTFHNLKDLRKNPIQQASDELNEQIDRYKEVLGQRENFITHATVALLSFLIFGMIPPITYAFSFHSSDDHELKLLAVGAASLVCIILLATGKAYVNPPKSYLKTVMYYVVMGFMVSGVSYAAGELIKRLLEKLHLFQTNSLLNPSPILDMTRYGSGRVTY